MGILQESLRISEVIKDEYGIAWCINALGVSYSRQGNEEKALEYFIRSLKMQEEMKDSISISYSLRNIGSAYSTMGDNEKALNYFERCLVIDKAMNAKRSLAFTLSSIGAIYQDKHDYDLALEYFQQSLDISREIGNRDMECGYLERIGHLHLMVGKNDLGIIECQKSYDIAIEIGSVEGQLDACECRYKGNKALGKYELALSLYETVSILEDSINIEALSDKLHQIEFQNQMIEDSMRVAEKELRVEMAHKIEVTEKEKSRNIFMGGGFMLLLLAAGLFYRNSYMRKAKNHIEKEKERSDNLLLNILPAEIAEELKEKGKADARDFNNVSILFTDFKDFTQVSQNLSAADLVAEINTCFKAFDTIVGKYQIEKIKTIGDAYMAAGGLPVPTDDSVRNTVLAALEMQAYITKRKTEKDALDKTAFDMRVGIHTGPVVAGIVGVKKFQYDIWGDAVNTASRIETNGIIGKVNISEGTYNLIKNDPDFTFENRGKVAVKGKGEIEMWFVSMKNS